MTQERLDEIQAKTDCVSIGPWQVQDSCSWRRIGGMTSRGFGDGNILRPYVARDGHPDLSTSEDVLDFIVMSRTAIPELLAEVERLRGELARSVPIAGNFPHLQPAGNVMMHNEKKRQEAMIPNQYRQKVGAGDGNTYLSDAPAKIAALEARVKVLEAALRPFAKSAEHLSGRESGLASVSLNALGLGYADLYRAKEAWNK
jgi:hypothetical protein